MLNLAFFFFFHCTRSLAASFNSSKFDTDFAVGDCGPSQKVRKHKAFAFLISVLQAGAINIKGNCIKTVMNKMDGFIVQTTVVCVLSMERYATFSVLIEG